MEIPKIIFFDIDGTLLNDDKKLSPETIRTIHYLNVLHDIELVLATGRPPLGTKKIYETLGLNGPLICLNGSLVVKNPFQSDFLVNKMISINVVLQIRKIVARLQISLNYLSQYDWFCEERDDWVIREEWILNSAVQSVKPQTFLSSWISKKSGPNKILFIGEPYQISYSYQLIRKHFPGDEISIVQTGKNYVEITNREISKGSGLETILSEKKVLAAETWAFGDNVNDVEMIDAVGRGIWMSNSAAHLKKTSEHTTRYSNHEDGVVRYIKKQGLV